MVATVAPGQAGREALLDAAAKLFEIDWVGGDAFMLDKAFDLYSFLKQKIVKHHAR